MTPERFPAGGEHRTRPRAASRLRYRYGHGTAAAPAMSPSSAGRQRRSLPRSGSPLWGAFLFLPDMGLRIFRAPRLPMAGAFGGNAAGASRRIRRTLFAVSGEMPATGAGQEPGIPPPLRPGPCARSRTAATAAAAPPAGKGAPPCLPGLAICGLLVYGSSFIEAHSGSGPGCPAMRYGAFFVVFRSWGRGRRQAGLQGLGRCGRSQPFWRIGKWLTSA